MASASGVVTEEPIKAVSTPDLTTDSGTSLIISPSEEYIAGPKWKGEGIVHAETDMDNCVGFKKQSTILQDTTTASMCSR